MPETLARVTDGRLAGRPFPWPCPKCRQKVVWPVVLPYSGSARYEGRTLNVELNELNVPRCENCGELVFDDWADEQIYRAFRSSARLLTPEQVQANRTALGLSRGELAGRLGVEEEQVAGWEEGRRIQSRLADNLLRVFFAYPQVRSVLGAGQAPNLGLTLGEGSLPPSP